MKRKVARAGKLRLSPNEEAMLLKEEYERRRKLRLQQVREQQKYIALRIRQEVKRRREEQLHQLEEALRAEWEKEQDQKMKALEKLYLSSLKAVGEGHRQARENEPDLEALAKQAEERKQRAEKRHRKALKEQKNQKEKLLHEQARLINARKHALDVEKERAARVASLPPPPPHPLENFEVKKIPTVKIYNADHFHVTHYHLSENYVDRERDREQVDARLVAEEEGKRMEELHREEERDRREQLEKAHIRGSHALKKVHLAQDRERLLKELEQMQSMDRLHRRHLVAQMPPQLFVPAYKRLEIKEDWQRELEFAFEDMYSEDRRMQGDLILHFEPQPLPSPSERSQDNELDVTLEHEAACDTGQELRETTEEVPDETESNEEGKNHQPQSKLALRKLLNKIRSQKEEWTSKSERECQNETETIESGTIASEERQLCDVELNHEQNKTSVSANKDSMEIFKDAGVAESSDLINPQEQAAKNRMEEERKKWSEQIEHQKQEQLALLKQIEEKRARLEADLLKIQIPQILEEVKEKAKGEEGQLVQNNSPLPDQQKDGEDETEITAAIKTASPRQASHLQMIRSYQQRLLQQNRLHKQTVEEARKCLQEYQNKLKQRYPMMPVTPLSCAEAKSVSLKVTSEPILQKQEVHPAQHQLSEQVHTQECGQSLPGNSETPQVLEKPSSPKYEEQRHNVCPGRRVRFLETSQWDQGVFHLPSSSSSQEQVEISDTSSIQGRDLARVQTPPGLAMALQDDPAVGTQPKTRTQHVRFVLPAENSSEPSGIFEQDKELSSVKTSSHQTEAEAVEEPPLTVPLLSATETPGVAQAASSDSQESHWAPAGSSIKTSFEQPPSLFQPLASSHEQLKAQEFLISKSGDASLLSYSSILNLRDRVLASSESIQAQQKYLKELQEQLDAQREALLSRQKMQEQLLIKKQDMLKEQMQRQQEALKEFLNKQVRQFNTNEVTWAKPNGLTDFLQTSENHQLENCETKEPEKLGCKGQKWKSSKPPLAKVKLGLNLEQHELSVIPEADTPRSCSISFADKTDSARGESLPVSPVGELACASCYSRALHGDGRFPGSIASCEEQTSSGSLQESEHSARPQGSPVTPDLPVLAAEVGNGGVSPSGASFRHHDMGILSKVLSTSFSSEAFMEGGPCDSSSTISTGSFLTSEILDAGPVDTGLSSCSTEDQMLGETTSHPWNSLLSFNMQGRRELFSATSGDAEASSADNAPFQVPAVEFDFPAVERPVANFLHQHFQPLEPSLDLDLSPLIPQNNISGDSRELGKASRFSRKSENTAVCVEGRGSSWNIHRSSLPSRVGTSKSAHTASEQEPAAESVTLGSEESFHPVQLEGTESDGCHGTEEQNPRIINQEAETWDSPARQYEELARNIESLNLQSAVEELRKESPNSLQEQNSFYQEQRSFYQLNTTPAAMDKTLPEHFIKEDAAFEKETLCSGKTPAEVAFEEYVKLAEKSVHGNEGNKAVEVASQWNINTKKRAQGSPETQKSSRHPVAPDLDTSDISLQAGVQQNGSFLERYKKSSNAVLRGSGRVPVWETESGRGIMEEPELTLTSSNDISIAESDAEHTSQGKAQDGKISNPACADQSEFSNFPEEREFLPLSPDTDYSVFKRPDGSFCAQSSDEATPLEFPSAPGTLQESFLKRKKDFIQKSQRRVEEIKSKGRKNGTVEAGQLQRRKTAMLSRPKAASPTSEKGAATTRLKKVGEVQVSSPADRKAAAVEMSQRTSRLYNQLTEVKIRKEERTRQEMYAKNREKAKEFQKKTLEKLRARKKPLK